MVAPDHLRESILKESHGGMYAGHFSGGKLYSTVCRNWWWPTIYTDVMDFCKNVQIVQLSLEWDESRYLHSIQPRYNALSKFLAWTLWNYL